MNFIEVSGTPYEMGFQQGAQLKGLISNSFEKIINQPEVDYLKPGIIPKNLFIYLVKKAASSAEKRAFKNSDKKYLERLNGLSDGAGVKIEELLFLQALETYLDKIDYSVRGCTSAGFKPVLIDSGEPVLIKNFDYINIFREYAIIRKSRPKDGYSSIDLTYASVTGNHDGMNEKGLVLLYNYGMTTEKVKPRLPLTVIIQKILETCTTVPEAIEILKERKYSNGAIVMAGDRDGNLSIIEISPEHISVREPEGDFIAATNKYFTKELIPYNIPENAYFKGNFPGLQELKIQESNNIRYNRLVQLIESRKQHDFSSLISILIDHGEEGIGTDNTICRHNDIFGTTVSAVFYPVSGKVFIASGYPCQTEFKEFSIL
ncbi:MAG: C45 family autoproteolytic acyltransferase/hydrolase [bacterium]|nr:C45 family autoproteolytic acyltransferase/hydrolase [bacterium]